MRKLYNITVYFDGYINYEIESESKDNAIKEAIDLFNDENSDIICKHLRKPLVQSDCEAETIGGVLNE